MIPNALVIDAPPAASPRALDTPDAALSRQSASPLPEWIARRRMIVLDFDGVILDSNTFKVECMGRALAPFGSDVVRPFLAYFRANFGKPRRRHFEVFLTQHLKDGRPFEPFFETYGTRYATLVSQGYADAALTEGVEAVLRAAKATGIPCYIATGGDPRQVEVVLKHKHLTDLFQGVYGAPEEKTPILRRLLETHDVAPADCLFFGDATSDRDAARATDIPFVFVSRYSLIDTKTLTDGRGGFWSVRDFGPTALRHPSFHGGVTP